MKDEAAGKKTLIDRLCQAADSGDTETARKLIKKGAPVNGLNAYGGSPLFYACVAGHADTVRLFIEAGAELDMCGVTPRFCCHEAETDAAGQGVFHWVSIYDHANLLQYFIDHTPSENLDLNKTDMHLYTPLHYACAMGNHEVVKLLLDHGADPNVVNDAKRTPLQVACVGRDRKKLGQIIDIFKERCPETALEMATKLPTDNPNREPIMEWFRENKPELVFEMFVASPGR